MLSAIRNITDKDDGPSEPPWTAAKSALEQDATRAGSSARKTWEVYPQGNISRKRGIA
ncbi:hypothetical protein ACVZYT_003370 [Yersinia enterocolitica]